MIKHIAFIVDGNRRFAKRLMLKPWKGHEWGAEKLKKVLEWCKEASINEVTLYTFSIQNFNRPKEEFDKLMQIFSKECKELIQEEKLAELKKQGIQVRFIGKLNLLPEEVHKKMQEIMTKTAGNGPRKVNFCMAYGGREELTDVFKTMAGKIKTGELDPKMISETTISEHLWLKSEPDLVIRTSGEKRTSNFLPWQSTYSELFFIDKYWPELEKEDFLQIIQEYEKRDRRYGK